MVGGRIKIKSYIKWKWRKIKNDYGTHNLSQVNLQYKEINDAKTFEP